MRQDPRDVWPVEERQPGQFNLRHCRLTNRPTVTACIHFICPRGKFCSVYLGPTPEGRRHEREPNVWGWDGSIEAPTLTPSINCIAEKDGKPTGGCGWHGFIQAGVMTHA